MTTITFDTLKLTKRMRAVGFTEEQAETFAEVQRETFAEVLDTTLATKGDVLEVKERIMLVEAELKLMKWMIGTTPAAVVAVLVRLFVQV